MYLIGKAFTFDAAHHLNGLSDTHKCSRVHGHTYTVTVVLRATSVDQTGFVVDYGELAGLKQWIDEQLDHRDLNDVIPMKFNPTAENLARYIFETCQQWDWYQNLHTVTVQETGKTMAAYTPYPGYPIVWTG